MRGLAIAVLCAPAIAHATAYDIHAGEDLYARLASLQAGDTVVVHAGTYTTPGFYEVTWAGTMASPIAITTAPGDHVILQGQPDQNVINITGSYFTLDGFEIRGGSHGLRLRTVAHATLSNLVLHDLGDVGISCNFEPESCDDVTIRHNEIYDTGHAGTGEGMYLGCNNDACRLTNSRVDNNYLHDIGGSQGDGIEIKSGSYGNVVVDNVIVRSNYPGITMYGFTGTHPVNHVQRNLVWHAKADNGIQIVGQIVVEDNVVIDSFANGIQSKPSQAETPHDVTIIHNTIIGAGTACLKTNNWATETNQVVANNALYCSATTAFDLNGGAAANAIISKNIGLGTTTAPAGFTAGIGPTDFVDFAGGNLYPAPGSVSIDAGDAAHTTAVDFNGTARDAMPDVGAYEVTTATNPGWIPVEGFKTSAATGGDGPGFPDDGGTTGTPGTPGGCCNTTGRPTGSLVLVAFVLVRLRRRR